MIDMDGRWIELFSSRQQIGKEDSKKLARSSREREYERVCTGL